MQKTFEVKDILRIEDLRANAPLVALVKALGLKCSATQERVMRAELRCAMADGVELPARQSRPSSAVEQRTDRFVPNVPRHLRGVETRTSRQRRSR